MTTKKLILLLKSTMKLLIMNLHRRFNFYLEISIISQRRGLYWEKGFTSR